MAHRHSVYDTDPHFAIDPITRTIKNQSGKVTLIRYDHNSERFTFEIPRYVDDHDMSLCNVVEIHYINVGTRSSNSGVYPVTDLQIAPDDDNVVICSWLVSQNATQYVGSLNFIVRFACTTDETIDYAWNTAIYSDVKIANGIYNSGEIIEEYYDILEQWKLELESKAGVRDISVTQTVTATDDNGINEFTFTLSDGSKQAVYVRNGSPGADGTKGDKGDAFTYDNFTEDQLADLKGDKGDKGDAFTYDDFTEEQLADLKGDAFTYDDFTEEQLADLKGDKGDAFTYDDFTEDQLKALTGSSIESIERTDGTGAPGTVDTYTITLTNGSTHTFEVRNGSDGDGAGDMTVAVYDPQGRATDIYQYVDDAIGEIGNNGIANEANLVSVTYLGDFEGKTIADLRTALDEWLGSCGSNIGICQFSAAGSFVDLWDANDTTTLIESGVRWTCTMIGTYYNSDYVQLRVTSYYTEAIHLLAKRGGEWVSAEHVISYTSGGDTWIDTNFYANYLVGKWLQTTADTHRSDAADKYAVLDGSGWIYHRTPDEVRQDIGAASNPNLLDNWYFADPINQRGQTEYTGTTWGYTIDRWKNKNTVDTVTVGDGVTLSNGSTTADAFLCQILNNAEELLGKTITMSVMLGDGTVHYASVTLPTTKPSVNTGYAVTDFSRVAYMNDYWWACLGAKKSVTNTFLAAKLELGSTQTLAHQDADGNWVLNDPPPDKGMELLKCVQSKADTTDTYTNKTIATGHLSNPNLLDNWYFADPIDQRGWWLVPPDTPYYSDVNLTVQAGTVSSYYVVNYVNGVYGTAIGGSTTYYVDWSKAFRGYAGASKYTIDRWKSSSGRGLIAVEDGELRITHVTDATTNAFLYQTIENGKNYWGKTVTGSVLDEDGDLHSVTWGMVEGGKFQEVVTPFGSIRIGADADGTGWGNLYFVIGVAKEGSKSFIAVKLELGSQQTLAHQENGNWVLNDPPPNKDLELLKCCMSTADSTDTYANNKVTPNAIGAVALDGSTPMPTDFTVQKSTPVVWAKDTVSLRQTLMMQTNQGVAEFNNRLDGAHKTTIRLHNEIANLNTLLQLIVVGGTSPGTYNILHTGNYAALVGGTSGLNIQTGDYDGTGSTSSGFGAGSPNSLTFSFVPKAVIVTMASGAISNGMGGFVWLHGASYGMSTNTDNSSTSHDECAVKLTWDDTNKTLQWYSTVNAIRQLNASGHTYYYIAIG